MPFLIDVVLQSGFTGTSQNLPRLAVTLPEIEFAAATFGSTYILRMGLHFDRYVIGGYQPWWSAVQGIYASANPTANSVRKQRATSVTGNIGESIASLVARRYFGSRTLDIESITPGRTKAPDYRVVFRPMVPARFTAVTGAALAVTFTKWPVESKAAATTGIANQMVERALKQLGSYWYGRYQWEPSVVGYGVICCFVFRGTVQAPARVIRVHLITPSAQNQLQTLIEQFRDDNDDRSGFLSALGDPNSPVRGCLRDA